MDLQEELAGDHGLRIAETESDLDSVGGSTPDHGGPEQWVHPGHDRSTPEQWVHHGHDRSTPEQWVHPDHEQQWSHHPRTSSPVASSVHSDRGWSSVRSHDNDHDIILSSILNNQDSQNYTIVKIPSELQ